VVMGDKKHSQDGIFGAINDPNIRSLLFKNTSHRGNGYLIEGDFFNLRALNDVLGREQVNQFMKVISAIVYQTLDDISSGDVYVSRLENCDEISFFLTAPSSSTINKALDSAQEKISRFVNDSGLSTLKHRKYAGVYGAGLYCASQAISEGDDYSIISDRLQFQISQQKQKQAFDQTPKQDSKEPAIIPIDMQFKKVLLSDNWKPYLQKEFTLPGISMSDFYTVNDNKQAFVIRSRQQRQMDLRELDTDNNNYSYIRLDLVNLGGLNDVLGQDATNAVRDKLREIVINKTSEMFDSSMFYDVGGGGLDLVIPTSDTDSISVLKNVIHNAIFDEVLSLQCSEFTTHADQQATELQTMNIGDLPQIANNNRGVGLVMADTPIHDTHDLAALFERVDCATAVLKLYNVAFIEQDGNDAVFAHYVGTTQHTILPNREKLEAKNRLPAARSLQPLLTSGNIIEIMNRPVGMITQQLFGYDLSEPLQRHQAIKHLLQSQTDGLEDEAQKRSVETEIQANILQNANSMEQFDDWISLNHSDFDAGRLTLLDRPEIHTRLNENLMTMNLSSRWGFIDEDVKDIVLEGQLTARLVNNINLAVVSNKVEDSISICAYAIRTGFENEPDSDVRAVQFAKEASDMLIHIENIKGNSSGLNSETLSALAHIACSNAQSIAKKCDAIGEGAVARAFEGLSSHENILRFKNSDEEMKPIDILRHRLNEARGFIQETRVIDDDVKQKILQKFEGLQAVSDSFSKSQKMTSEMAKPSTHLNPVALFRS
jgi:GGDEF domain-containing protein